METVGSTESVTRKKFAVVHFTAENKFSVVPSKWMSAVGKVCSWPNRKTKNCASLQEDPDSEPQSNWTSHSINFVKAYSTFGKAKERSSNLKNSRSLEISESSESGERISKFRRTSPVSTRVAPTQPLHDFGVTPGESVSKVEINLIPDLGEPPDPEVAALDILEVNQQIPVSVDFEQIGLVSHASFEELKQEFRVFQEASLTKQEEVLTSLKDIHKTLRTLLASNYEHSQIAKTNQSRCTLPIRTEEEFHKTEEAIENLDEFNNLVNELERINGETVPKTVYDILSHLVSHQLALKIRLTDNSGKLAFGNSRVSKAVIVAVQRRWSELKPSEHILRGYIGSWFRNSTGRKGGRKRKRDGNAQADKETENTSSSSRNPGQNQSSIKSSNSVDEFNESAVGNGGPGGAMDSTDDSSS